jgi:hypothetical protein
VEKRVKALANREMMSGQLVDNLWMGCGKQKSGGRGKRKSAQTGSYISKE